MLVAPVPGEEQDRSVPGPLALRGSVRRFRSRPSPASSRRAGWRRSRRQQLPQGLVAGLRRHDLVGKPSSVASSDTRLSGSSSTNSNESTIRNLVDDGPLAVCWRHALSHVTPYRPSALVAVVVSCATMQTRSTREQLIEIDRLGDVVGGARPGCTSRDRPSSLSRSGR